MYSRLVHASHPTKLTGRRERLFGSLAFLLSLTHDMQKESTQRDSWDAKGAPVWLLRNFRFRLFLALLAPSCASVCVAISAVGRRRGAARVTSSNPATHRRLLSRLLPLFSSLPVCATGRCSTSSSSISLVFLMHPPSLSLDLLQVLWI
jgi:hypothetical protein